MKKCVLLNIVSLSLFISCNSQTNNFEFGFQGGKNFNYANGPGLWYGDIGKLNGLSAGGHIKRKISKHFGVKALLSYDQFGWAFKSITFQPNSSSNPVKFDVTSKINYLNMPVLAEFSFGRHVKLNLDCGVFLGVLLNNQYTINYYQTETSDEATTIKNLSDKYRRLNFGLSLGCGIQVPVSSKIKIELNLRNHNGISNSEKDNGTGNHQILTNTFAILGGVSFAL